MTQKITRETLMRDIESLRKAVKDFPYYSHGDKKTLSFGQYVTVIATHREEIRTKCNWLTENLKRYLLDLEIKAKQKGDI